MAIIIVSQNIRFCFKNRLGDFDLFRRFVLEYMKKVKKD